jgi:hypothetical protein
MNLDTRTFSLYLLRERTIGMQALQRILTQRAANAERDSRGEHAGACEKLVGKTYRAALFTDTEA